MEEKKQIDKRLNELIEIMQFTEKVTAKLHGLKEESKIYSAVIKKFAAFGKYTLSILLLTDDKSKLKVAGTSMKSNIISMGEKTTGLKYKDFKIDLKKSGTYRSVVKEGKTVFFNVDEIMNELFPKPIALLLSKIALYENKLGIITPLQRDGKIIGAVSLGSPELAEDFIPSVKNLAQHISTALELAEEYTERNNSEAALRKRFKELNCLYAISNLAQKKTYTIEEILQGVVNLIIPSWQYPLNTYARITLEGQEFRTGNFKETIWKQTSDIKVFSKKEGVVEVYYLKEKPEADEGSFLNEERDLINLIADQIGRISERAKAQKDLKTVNKHLKSTNKNLYASEQQLKALNQQLAASELQLLTANYNQNERVKELSCLYGISKLINRKNITLTGVLKGTVKLIRSSWQYPEITCVRVIIMDQEFRTENFTKTTWKLTSNIKILGQQIGTVEIYYLEEKPEIYEGPFLKEERSFIIVIAEELGRFVERSFAEEALKESEEKYRLLIENSNAAITSFNENGTYLFLNEVAAQWLNGKPQDYIGKTVHDTFPKAVADMFVERFRRIFKSGVGEIIKEVVKPLNRWISSNIQPVKKGDTIIGVQIVTHDITERKKAEEAVRESEARYRTLFEGSADGIIIADVETKKFKYVNKALCEMLGYNEGEITNMGVLDIHPKESLDHVIDEFMAQAKGEKTLAEDIPCLKKDGTILYADINTSPLILNGRKYNVGFFRDITERKKAEEERIVLEEQLRQGEKLRAIGELAGGVAHDFNNMLGAIVGYADLIDEDNRDENGNEIDAVLGKRINTITGASRRAADLIKKLLAFSRRGVFRNAPIDMHEIISDVLTLLEGSIDRKILIKKKLIAANTIIKGDPSQVQNAILNIAINACDAMRNGGVLLISTRNETLEKDQYFAEIEAGNYLVVSVSDTGKGMDEETKSRVFEPFFSTKGVGEGTGLGLASVYGTVKSHNGGVTVESRIGVGTIFRLYLPVVDKEDSDIEIECDKLLESGHGTILCVDDEEMVREMVSDILSKCGYTVYTCNNGSEAVNWYKEFHSGTDLVISDMIMPVMDGLECYKKLKEVNPDVKVVLASGYSINEKVQKLLEEGALEFIEKPFSRASLSKLVARKLKDNGNSKTKIDNKEHITLKHNSA